jgi:hypothetical protein
VSRRIPRKGYLNDGSAVNHGSSPLHTRGKRPSLTRSASRKYRNEPIANRAQLANEERDRNTLGVYLKQYEQCWEDKRALEAMIWQTPAVFLAIVAVLLAGVITRGFPVADGYGTARLVTLVTFWLVLFLAFVVSGVGTVQLRKHRLWCMTRVDDLRFIEGNLRKMADVYHVQFITSDLIKNIANYPDIESNRTCIDKQIDDESAYKWLFRLGIAITVVLLVACLAWPFLVYLSWI